MMSLVNMKEMLNKAKEGKYAVGQFNINNLEWTQAILQAAQEENWVYLKVLHAIWEAIDCVWT